MEAKNENYTTEVKAIKTNMRIEKMNVIAKDIRKQLILMSHQAKAAHLGSALSCVDILVAAYWGKSLRLEPTEINHSARDRVILSKGHAAAALYAVLASRGFFCQELIDSYGEYGTCLPEHPARACVPGVEVATGSLGHGLGLGAGMTLAARIQKRQSKVLVVVSDGECNEGSLWEGAMFAAARKLERLMVIVDFNKWQATGRSREIMALEPLADKWRAFGWETREIDGHNMEDLTTAISSFPTASGKPLAIVAHTVKGKGVSFMEDDNNWHYRIPNKEEVQAAMEELSQ